MTDKARLSHTQIDLCGLEEELRSELQTFRSNAFLFRTMADEAFVQILEVKELRRRVRDELAQMKCLLRQWNEVAQDYRASVSLHS